MPRKPSDWQDAVPVTSDQQQPPKARGRKKKVDIEVEKPCEKAAEAEGKKGPKAKGRAKAKGKKAADEPPVNLMRGNQEEEGEGPLLKARRRGKAPKEYEPLETMELEMIGYDPRLSCDMYAAACAAVDVHRLKGAANPVPAEEPVKKSRKNAPKQPEGNEAQAKKPSRAKRELKAEDPPAEDKEEKDPPARARKKTRCASPLPTKDAPEEVAGTPSMSKPKGKTEEEKKLKSRKSMAYVRAKKAALKAGKTAEEASAAGKEVRLQCNKVNRCLCCGGVCKATLSWSVILCGCLGSPWNSLTIMIPDMFLFGMWGLALLFLVSLEKQCIRGFWQSLEACQPRVRSRMTIQG